ncbi:hypothetical protein [Streptomyces agglomeratus]|uniref:hypothetical protein n=1 Tax=Streptomyces agglomeratus TaxID=285458 RepID=UPI0009A02ECC|nr:hypothetical protein [Streptomyces agglomeratus]
MIAAETAQGHPQRWERGEVAKDARTGRVGRVMGHVGPRYQLRPLNGGKEWEAELEHLTPAMQSDALSGAVAEANAHAVRGI